MDGNSPDRPGNHRASAAKPGARDRDGAGRARNARPRDGLGRPLPHDARGVPRQPEGVVRAPEATVAEAQRLLDEGKPFHAHEVFEDAWKSGPEDERELWRGLAQLCVGLTHTARGNSAGGDRLLRRGAATVEEWGRRHGGERPHGIALGPLVAWARALASEVATGPGTPPTAVPVPRLRG